MVWHGLSQVILLVIPRPVRLRYANSKVGCEVDGDVVGMEAYMSVAGQKQAFSTQKQGETYLLLNLAC